MLNSREGYIISQNIKTVEKAIRILEQIADRPSTFTELIQLMNSNKATIHRFLTTFENLGYIKKHDDDRYHMTTKLHSIGMKNYFQLHFLDIIKPYLIDFANEVKESTVIASYSNDKVHYLEKIESPSALRIVVSPGESAPLYCVASGKLYLAHFTDDELESYLDREPLKEITENTILSKEKFRNEIAKIRKQGFAVDNEEWQQYLTGIAFPIYDNTNQMVASLCIAGVSYRMTEEKIRTVVPKAMELSEKISNLIGNQKRDYY